MRFATELKNSQKIMMPHSLFFASENVLFCIGQYKYLHSLVQTFAHGYAKKASLSAHTV